MPKTYRLDNSGECLEFLNDEDVGLFIEKRFYMNRGLGIRVIYDLKEYKESLMSTKKFTPSYDFKGMLDTKGSNHNLSSLKPKKNDNDNDNNNNTDDVQLLKTKTDDDDKGKNLYINSFFFTQ